MRRGSPDQRATSPAVPASEVVRQPIRRTVRAIAGSTTSRADSREPLCLVSQFRDEGHIRWFVEPYDDIEPPRRLRSRYSTAVASAPVPLWSQVLRRCCEVCDACERLNKRCERILVGADFDLAHDGHSIVGRIAAHDGGCRDRGERRSRR